MTVVGQIPADTASATERALQPTYDASNLPSVVYGPRVATWWGTVGFMVVEAATLSAALASYYYIRRNFTAWPPLRTPPPDLLLPTISLGVLLAILVPSYFMKRAAEEFDVQRTRRWAWASVVVMLTATALRLLEFPALNVRWDTNAYGSVAWAILVAHFTLLVVDSVETLVFAVMTQRGTTPPRYFPGLAEDGFYSFFMVLVWIPCYVTVYLVPHWT